MIETILIPSCRAAVLIGGLFLLRWCLGNRISPTMRHAFWGFVPLALLPLAIASPVSVYNLLPHLAGTPAVEVESRERPDTERGIPTECQQWASDIFSTERSIPTGMGNAPVQIVMENAPETHSVGMPRSVDASLLSTRNLTIAALFVYLAGCIAMVVIFLRQILLCRRWLAEATPVKSEEVLTLFEACRQKMKVKTWLVVSESPAVSGPFLIGVIRPTLLLPQGMISSAAPFRATPQQLRTVFLHELAHLKRWDVWIGWLATLLLVVHWFNPLLWLAIRRMNADREEATDALALKTLNASDRTAYAHSLLDIVEWCTHYETVDDNCIRPVRAEYISPGQRPGLDAPQNELPPCKGKGDTALPCPYRAAEGEEPCYPGRCPGLKCDALTGRAKGSENKNVPGRFSPLSPFTPGLVGISETGKLLHRRINMINQNRTWKLRWQILAVVAAMLIGAATLTDAQERRPVADIQADIEERRQAIAEMQVDIGKLQAELIETKVAEGIELDEDERIVEFYPVPPENIRMVGSMIVMLRQEMPNAMFMIEFEKNMIVVTGTKADHDKVKTMLAELEAKLAESEDERIVAFYPVPLEQIPMIMQTMRHLTPNARVSIDEKSARISVVGTKADHDKVREMLAQWEKAQANGSPLPASAPQRVGEVILFQKSFELAPNSPLTVKETVAAIQARLTTPEGHQFSWGSDEARIFNVIGSERFHENVRGVLIQPKLLQSCV